MVFKLIVDEDEMTFQLKRGLTKDEVSSAAQQLNIDLQGLTRTTKAKISMKVLKDERGYSVRFAFVRPSGIPVSTTDLEFMKDRYDVDDKVLQKFVDAINRA